MMDMLSFWILLLSLGLLFLVLSGWYIGDAEKRKAVMLGVHLTLVVPGSFHVAGYLIHYRQSFASFMGCLVLTVVLVVTVWYIARFFIRYRESWLQGRR